MVGRPLEAFVAANTEAPATAPPAPPGGPGGPPPPAAVEATLGWVSEVFSRYYAENPPPMPSRYARREFGFLWNGKKFFLRHTAFLSPAAFRDFLAREAPHHCYYSTAYYKTPHAATMKEKEWLGADLIFDLDADHLPGGDKMSFAEQLKKVHDEAKKLLNDFLLGDFGFDADHIRIVFSGGRGYHFHVTDPRVQQLDSAARREIVDYLSPNETIRAHIVDTWMPERTYHTKFGPKREKLVRPATVGGWHGRLTSTLADYLEELMAMNSEAAIDALCQFKGVGPAKAQNILSKLSPRFIETLRKGSDWTGYINDLKRSAEQSTHSMANIEFPPALQQAVILRAFAFQMPQEAEGETDEPVTADIKRLIRLPGSLHGKTGLRVTPLTIDEFQRFDPLRDAVALGDEPVRILVSKPTQVPLKGADVTVQPGEQELPLHQAMFVVLRRAGLRPYSAPAAADLPPG